MLGGVVHSLETVRRASSESVLGHVGQISVASTFLYRDYFLPQSEHPRSAALTMNRSWFRNPFTQRHDAEDGEGSTSADDAGILSGDMGSNNSRDGNRKRRRKLHSKDTGASMVQ